MFCRLPVEKRRTVALPQTNKKPLDDWEHKGWKHEMSCVTTYITFCLFHNNKRRIILDFSTWWGIIYSFKNFLTSYSPLSFPVSFIQYQKRWICFISLLYTFIPLLEPRPSKCSLQVRQCLKDFCFNFKAIHVFFKIFLMKSLFEIYKSYY